MPPIAEMVGNVAFEIELSSPSNNSRLISSPANRKNMNIRPSLINKITGFDV